MKTAPSPHATRSPIAPICGHVETPLAKSSTRPASQAATAIRGPIPPTPTAPNTVAALTMGAAIRFTSGESSGTRSKLITRSGATAIWAPMVTARARRQRPSGRGPSSSREDPCGGGDRQLKPCIEGETRVEHEQTDHRSRKKLPRFHGEAEQTSDQDNRGHHRGSHHGGLESGGRGIDRQPDQADNGATLGPHSERPEGNRQQPEEEGDVGSAHGGEVRNPGAPHRHDIDVVEPTGVAYQKPCEQCPGIIEWLQTIHHPIAQGLADRHDG